jgi:glutamate decarboxylase
MLEAVDEHTIGVVGILGVTYDGRYEPIADLAAALDDLQARTGLDVPLHVDGASGAFVAPFLAPDLAWDFRLSRVHSINTSGHKYGLVYPGLGWVVWAKREYLPEDLVFSVSYLGGDMPTLAINFSRPGAQVLLQYYNFLRLGRDGYRRVQQACQDVALHFSGQIAEMPDFEVLTDGSELPLVTWTLADDHDGPWDLHDLSERLRGRGWQVPAYPMPDDIADLTVMRIVVRNGVSMDLVGLLLDDIRTAITYLDALPAPLPKQATSGFHH